jgi:hypothetical protein
VSLLFSRLIYKDIISKVSPSDLLWAIESPTESRQGGQALLGMSRILDEITGGIVLGDADKGEYRRYVEVSRVVAETVGLAPGASGLIINGRVRLTVSLPVSYRDVSRLQIVGPIASGEFTAEDYQTLQNYELATRVQPVLSALEDVIPASTGYDRCVLKLSGNGSFAENRFQCNRSRFCVDGVFHHIWASSGRSVPIWCLQQGSDIKESKLQFYEQSIYVGGS